MELKKVKEKEEEQADLLPLLKTCWTIGLQNWHWFLLSVIVCLGLGFIYLQSQPRVYQRQAVMLIEDAQGNSMSGPMPRSRTRSWSGAPLMSLQNAADRAAMTTTKKGLKVYVHINSKTYDIKRPIEESYQKRLARQVIFAPELGQSNYLVKPAN